MLTPPRRSRPSWGPHPSAAIVTHMATTTTTTAATKMAKPLRLAPRGLLLRFLGLGGGA